ncbi:MAG: GIY-YIG nuclease family protein [Litorimonas sp.]
MRTYYVYILCNHKNGTLYIGVTNDIHARLEEHREKRDSDSFTAKYDLTRLVYLETFDDVSDAIRREKRLKKYKRQWKINLIEAGNPNWDPISLAHDD